MLIVEFLTKVASLQMSIWWQRFEKKQQSVSPENTNISVYLQDWIKKDARWFGESTCECDSC